MSVKRKISDYLISFRGNNDTKFYTKSNMLIAVGYNRIVIGERGPYIEFSKNQMILENLFIPEEQKYRVNSNKVYYIEYRTIRDYVKVYYQKKKVKYADYQLEMYYISPYEIFADFKEGRGKVIKENIQLTLKKFSEGE